MRRKHCVEIIGDHVRDEDEQLERRDQDRPALGLRPDLSTSKLLASSMKTSVPTLAASPTPAAAAAKQAAELYRKYKPNYADHVLSLTTKI